MTTEELRNTIVESCDNLLNLPRFRWLMTEEQRKLVRAQRNYWANAGADELEKLLAQYNSIRESNMSGVLMMKDDAAVLNLTDEQKKQLVEKVKSEAGFDVDLSAVPWDKILLILRYAIELFFGSEPAFQAASHDGCDHKELCEQTVRSACCTLHCALHHYEACCKHDH